LHPSSLMNFCLHLLPNVSTDPLTKGIFHLLACSNQRLRHRLLHDMSHVQLVLLGVLCTRQRDMRFRLAQPTTDLFALRVVAAKLLVDLDGRAYRLVVAKRTFAHVIQPGFPDILQLLHLAQPLHRLGLEKPAELAGAELCSATARVHADQTAFVLSDLLVRLAFDARGAEGMRCRTVAEDHSVRRKFIATAPAGFSLAPT
jgi:hypothetical protein